ncbi:DnaJ domain-containing protein [Bauldia litoralis]|uniref:DnaJ domain-containing protein n=2 Tax=Bauldia litoralis TaxID=665467 RepID=A0A1G6AVL7_9HYPH|nr:DnaJ domain-containing protein [Bauldia litoralis]
MVYFITGVGALIALLVLARAFVGANPRMLLRLIRYAVGGVMVVFGLGLSLARRVDIGLPLIVLGASAIFMGRIGPIDLGGSSRTPGSTSKVTSAFLEMELDHDTGKLGGRVVGGAYAGRRLDDLDVPDLRKLSRELAIDRESLALFEAYLDSRIPGWREDVEGDGAAGAGSPADAGPMTDEQAYEILGLAPGAGEAEIRRAHRQLMKGVHPDQGGSTFLAAKINEAKDRLLSGHR